MARAFNDPIVDCCGRDAADCDCWPITLTEKERNALIFALNLTRGGYRVGLSPVETDELVKRLGREN